MWDTGTRPGLVGKSEMDAELDYRRMPDTTRTLSLWVLWAVLGACMSLPATTSAQEKSNPEKPNASASDSQPTGSPSKERNTISETKDTSGQEKTPTARGSFVVAPLPISSPALGTGIIPVLGYIFPFRRDDKVSPPSVVAATGLVTNNGSRAFAAYTDLFVREDTYRITAVYARGNLNYDLYGIGLAAGNAGASYRSNKLDRCYAVKCCVA